jgi:hypothetical protein
LRECEREIEENISSRDSSHWPPERKKKCFMCLKCGQNNGFVLRDTLRALLPLSCDEMLLAAWGFKTPFYSRGTRIFLTIVRISLLCQRRSWMREREKENFMEKRERGLS